MLNNAPNVIELREHCPGSAGLAEGLPKDPQTEEMLKGLALHAAIDDVLARGHSWQVATLAHGVVDDYDKMTVATAQRVMETQIRVLEQQLDAEAGTVTAEVVVNLTAAGWFGVARLDFVVKFVDSTGKVVAVLVVELKTGTMVVTGPEANRQLHDYLVGAASLYPDVQRFYGAILQPAVVAELAWRIGSWTRTEVLDYFTTVVWAAYTNDAEEEQRPGLAQQLAAIRSATQGPDAPLKWGDHCNVCRLKEMCPARRGAVQDARKILADSGTTVADYMAKLTPADRLVAWKTAKQAASYLKKFDEMVKAWIMDDPKANTVPGFKVGPGRSAREFDSQVPAPVMADKLWDLAAVELQANGFKAPADLLQAVSPAKLEELLPEPAFTKLQAAGLVVKVAGALSVVEDKAPAMPRPRKKG